MWPFHCCFLLLPARKHARNPEVRVQAGVQARVVNPHREECLRNLPQMLFNPSGLDISSTDCQCVATHSVGENLQDWDLVFEGFE